MGQYVFGTSVRGASHARSNKPCQDSCTYRKKGFRYSNQKSKANELYAALDAEAIIISVADGHGSDSCPFSQTGAVIATNVFCDLMAEFSIKYSGNTEALGTYLNREADTKFAKAIDTEWKKRVLNQHKLRSRLDNHTKEIVLPTEPDDIYKQYGTTLLGLYITKEFVFAFQIGDGDILHVDSTGITPLINSDKILGVETHSLSKTGAWRNAFTRLMIRESEEKRPFMYMLSSDGMANSFISEAEFHKSCSEYFKMIQEHGCCKVEQNLSEWLSETSRMGCGDDITAVFAYFDEEQIATENENI